MANYYNEFDHKTAEWLRLLIQYGIIPEGEVDERSIVDVRASDLRGFTQCHFFAGIAGWPQALRLAGVPDDWPVWTGSCPCQSFSAAGKGGGTSDHRDLWPVFAALIRERQPVRVFGEQVASAIKFGWLDRLRVDLEAEGYAVGGHVLGAHSVGADHQRKRLYWVAESAMLLTEQSAWTGPRPHEANSGRTSNKFTRFCAANRMAHPAQRGLGADGGAPGNTGHAEQCGEDCGVANPEPTNGGGELEAAGARCRGCGPGGSGDTGGLGNPGVCGLPGNNRGRTGQEPADGRESGVALGYTDSSGRGEPCGSIAVQTEQQSVECGSGSFWSNAVGIPCRDGKTRRIPKAERRFQSVADGFSELLAALRSAGASEDEIRQGIEAHPLICRQQGRVMLLRGAGNAIVPQVSAEFIRAYMECHL